MNIGTDQVLTEFNTYFAVYFNVSTFSHMNVVPRSTMNTNGETEN